MQYVERYIESQDWITLILAGCFVILAFISVKYKKRFDDFIKLPISNNFFIAKGDTEELKHPFNILLFGIQIISISLFILLFFPKEDLINSSLFFQILIGTSVFVAIKVFIEKMLGTIFSLDSVINTYLFKKLTYTNYLTFFIFLSNLIFYYYFKPDLNTLFIFTSIFILFYSLIIYYSLKNHRTLILSNLFYFILYLCTLEISPFIILYKAAV